GLAVTAFAAAAFVATSRPAAALVATGRAVAAFAAGGWPAAAAAVAADEPSTVASRPSTSSGLRGMNLATEAPEGWSFSVLAHRPRPARRARETARGWGWCPAIRGGHRRSGRRRS